MTEEGFLGNVEIDSKMAGNIIEQKLKSRIIPKRTRILKCDGTGRRPVVSNDGVKTNIGRDVDAFSA